MKRITSPTDPAWTELESEWVGTCNPRDWPTNRDSSWPQRELELLGSAGVYEWFLPASWNGQEWSDESLLLGLIRLGSLSLTSSFILTQRAAACTRLAASANPRLRGEFAEGLSSGSLFATVAISHLTTSRQHFAHPILRAEKHSDGWRLNGYSAWVTGAIHADVVVVGATTQDHQQVMLAVDPWTPGFRASRPESLVALSASHTGRVDFHDVLVPFERWVAGPCDDVMRVVDRNSPGQCNAVGGSGGLQTSALALGLSGTAIAFLESEEARRPELGAIRIAFRLEWESIRVDLLCLARGESPSSRDEVRSRANSLVLRSTKAALAAAKGTGYLASHPAGRCCRESLFFLVWSCPQGVVTANLCELAMLESGE